MSTEITKDDIWVNVIYAGDIGEPVVLEEDHNKIVGKLLAKIQEQKIEILSLKEEIEKLKDYRYWD